MAVLLVEHDLDMVAKVVDRVVVLDVGEIIAEGTLDEVMADPGSVAPTWEDGVSTPVPRALPVSAAYSTYRALFGVTFSVPERCDRGALGSNGAGKSTVARVVSGLVPVGRGHGAVGGGATSRSCPAHRIAQRGLAHVPEGRAVSPP